MADEVVIYHNPSCSKSRTALDEISKRGHRPQVVDYLQSPLNEEQIRALLKRLGIAASSLIRAGDFHRLGLEPTNSNDKLIALIAAHPILLERPIVVVGERAVIARPVERIDDILPPTSEMVVDGAE